MSATDALTTDDPAWEIVRRRVETARHPYTLMDRLIATIAADRERIEQLEALLRDLKPLCRYVDHKEAEAFKERISRALPQNQEAGSDD